MKVIFIENGSSLFSLIVVASLEHKECHTKHLWLSTNPTVSKAYQILFRSDQNSVIVWLQKCWLSRNPVRYLHWRSRSLKLVWASKYHHVRKAYCISFHWSRENEKKKKNLFVQLESWMKVMIIYLGIKLHFIGIYYHGMFKRSCFGTVQITLVYMYVWVLV